MEDLLITKVQNGIRAIKLGTKTPEEAEVGKFLTRLQKMNSPWYEELLQKYMNIKKFYDNKNTISS